MKGMKGLLILIILSFGFFLNQCRSTEPAVTGIELEIDLAEPLYDNSIIDFRYNWIFSDPSLEYRDELMVFVHVWHVEGERMMFQDDHRLMLRDNGWPEGAELSYLHTVHMPEFIYYSEDNGLSQEKLRINAGLYDPRDKEYNYLLFSRLFSFNALPCYYPRVSYGDGWYEEEIIGPGITQSWRWMKKQAKLYVDNIGMDMELQLVLGVLEENLPDQSVSLYVNEKLLDEFRPDEAIYRRNILIPEAVLNDEAGFEMLLETNKSFIPSESGTNPDDSRELGLMVYSIYFKAL